MLMRTSLDDDLGVQGARAMDGLEDLDEVPWVHPDVVERRDQLADRRALDHGELARPSSTLTPAFCTAVVVPAARAPAG